MRSFDHDRGLTKLRVDNRLVYFYGRKISYNILVAVFFFLRMASDMGKMMINLVVITTGYCWLHSLSKLEAGGFFFSFPTDFFF